MRWTRFWYGSILYVLLLRPFKRFSKCVHVCPCVCVCVFARVDTDVQSLELLLLNTSSWERRTISVVGKSDRDARSSCFVGVCVCVGCSWATKCWDNWIQFYRINSDGQHRSMIWTDSIVRCMPMHRMDTIRVWIRFVCGQLHRYTKRESDSLACTLHNRDATLHTAGRETQWRLGSPTARIACFVCEARNIEQSPRS